MIALFFNKISSLISSGGIFYSQIIKTLVNKIMSAFISGEVIYEYNISLINCIGEKIATIRRGAFIFLEKK